MSKVADWFFEEIVMGATPRFIRVPVSGQIGSAIFLPLGGKISLELFEGFHRVDYFTCIAW